MADPLTLSVKITDNGYPTHTFESYWFGVTQLATGIPDLDISTIIFDPKPTQYFEEIWNIAAELLLKEDINTSVTMVDEEGYPTAELYSYWDDLIT